MNKFLFSTAFLAAFSMVAMSCGNRRGQSTAASQSGIEPSVWTVTTLPMSPMPTVPGYAVLAVVQATDLPKNVASVPPGEPVGILEAEIESKTYPSRFERNQPPQPKVEIQWETSEASAEIYLFPLPERPGLVAFIVRATTENMNFLESKTPKEVVRQIPLHRESVILPPGMAGIEVHCDEYENCVLKTTIILSESRMTLDEVLKLYPHASAGPYVAPREERLIVSDSRHSKTIRIQLTKKIAGIAGQRLLFK